MSSFAPWTEPHWKPSRMEARLAKAKKVQGRKDKESENKTQARKRDGYKCRFPRCVCHQLKLSPAVAHLEHKGAGGNPAGDRSHVKRLICLCPPRHRESRVSLDMKTVRVIPLTSTGTNGVIAVAVDVNALDAGPGKHSARARWVVVGREQRIHVWEPFTPEQIAILDRIAELES